MDQKVNPQRGWYVFLASLIVGALLGGTVRFIFSSGHIREKIEASAAFQKIPVPIKMNQIRLSLADGIKPAIALEVGGVQIDLPGSCQKPLQIKISKVYFPIALAQLFQGYVGLSRAEISNAQVYQPTWRGSCEAQETSPSPVETPAPSEQPKSSTVVKDHELWTQKSNELRRYFSKNWGSHREDLRQILPRVSIESLEWFEHQDGADTLVLQLQSTRLTLPEESPILTLRSEIASVPSWLPESTFDHLRFEGLVSPQTLELSLTAQVREGNLETSASYNFESGFFSSRFSAKNLPVNALMQVARYRNLTEWGWSPNYLWLSCSGVYSGQLVAWEAADLTLSDCVVNGDAGKIVAKDLRLYPMTNKRFDPFLVTISGLKIKKIVDALGRQGPRGALSQFGELNGEVSVRSTQDMSFTGAVNDLEMFFINKGVRGRQHVSRVHGQIHWLHGRYLGIIDEVELESGQFNGVLSFDLDEKFLDGEVQAKISALELHPSIQNLLVEGRLAPMELYGKAVVSAGEFSLWQGNFGFKTIENDQWHLDTVKVKTDFKEDILAAKVQVGQLTLREDNPYQKVIRPLFLDYERLGPETSFSDINGTIKVERQKGQWSKLSANGLNKSVVFSSQGEWNHGALEGEVTVDFPHLKLLTWNLSGEAEKPVLLPSLKMFKTLAKKEPKRNLSLSVTDQLKQEFVTEILANQKGSRFDLIKETVVETAKKLLPVGQSPEGQPTHPEKDPGDGESANDNIN